MELKTNVHGKQLTLRIKFFKETGMLAIKNNFEYMNWLEEQYIKQLALHNVSQQRELLIGDFIEKYNEGLVGNERIHESCLEDYLKGNL